MAQQTAFLNSAAEWFNHDFHHTMIHNALLAQVWVIFSDMETKPEFQLGNWTIEAGKAIIKCTRTTGVFSWEEILALFNSTVQEPVDVSWNKKIYIEIPEWFINDSTTITDALTEGKNLNVWEIKSTVDYPAHSNYIPLWEVTWWDRGNATDVRPETLRFGKKNTISYFDETGKEQHIWLDAASIGKYLKSNWPGNPPEMDDPTTWATIKSTTSRYVAGEQLNPWNFVCNNLLSSAVEADDVIDFWDDMARSRRSFRMIGNGEEMTEIKLNLLWVWSPADNAVIRIETDNAGQPSGSLIDTNAEGTISGGVLGASLVEETVTFTGAFTPTKGSIYHVVLQRSGAISGTNYYGLWVKSASTRAYTQRVYDGSVWGAIDTQYTPYFTAAGFYNGLRCKTKANDLAMIQPEWVCTLFTLPGAESLFDTDGTSSVFTDLEVWKKQYLSDTPGEVSTTPGTYNVFVGISTSDTDLLIDFGESNKGENIWTAWEGVYAGKDWNKLQMRKINGGKGMNVVTNPGWEIELSTVGQGVRDAIVAADGSWDYLLVEDAISDWHFRIFVMPGTYNEVNRWDLSEGNSTNGYPKYVIQGCGNNTVINMHEADAYKIRFNETGDDAMFEIRDMRFNVTLGNYNGADNVFIYSWYWKSILENLNIYVTIDNTYTETCPIINGQELSVIRWCLIKSSFIGNTGNFVELDGWAYYDCDIELPRMILSPNIMNSCKVRWWCKTLTSVGRWNECDLDLNIIADGNINFQDAVNCEIQINIDDNTWTTQDISVDKMRGSWINIEDNTAWALTGTTTIDDISNITWCTISLNFPGDVSRWKYINNCEIDGDSEYSRTHRTNSTYTSFNNCQFNDQNTSSTFLVEDDGFRYVGWFLKIRWGMTVSSDYSCISNITYFDCDIVVTSSFNNISNNVRCDNVTFNSGANDNVCIWNTSVNVTDNWTWNVVANNT